MKRLLINFLKVSLIVALIVLSVIAVSQTLLYLDSIIEKYYFFFVDYLFVNHNIKPELTLGISTILIFIVLPTTISITYFERYWDKPKG